MANRTPDVNPPAASRQVRHLGAQSVAQRLIKLDSHPHGRNVDHRTFRVVGPAGIVARRETNACPIKMPPCMLAFASQGRGGRSDGGGFVADLAGDFSIKERDWIVVEHVAVEQCDGGQTIPAGFDTRALLIDYLRGVVVN